MAQLTLLDAGLRVAGIMATAIALGSGFGVTIALLEEKSLSEIEFCGFVGTAIGFLLGVFLLIGAVIVVKPL